MMPGMAHGMNGFAHGGMQTPQMYPMQFQQMGMNGMGGMPMQQFGGQFPGSMVPPSAGFQGEFTRQ